MIHRASQSCLLFPERQPVNLAKKVFSDFDRQTERELAHVFGRVPRDRPYAQEVPYYPFSFHKPKPRVTSHHYRVSFALRYNPFAVTNQE